MSKSCSQPWVPFWEDESRDDLLCNSCRCPDTGPGLKPESEEVNKCCTCYSGTTWEGQELELHVEYVSVLGRSIVISDLLPNSSEVYKVVHQYSEMTEIPSNICNWDNQTKIAELYADSFQNMDIFWENLVILDFTGSKIRSLPDINCLVRLDQLILAHNYIQVISNTSFVNLSRLRIINLEGNGLKTLEPSIFTSPSLNIFFALFRDNELDKLDVSNMFSMYPFCIIDYKDNSISEIVNENDFQLDMDQTYGPGYISFEDNPIKEFPNFLDLLPLDDWAQMGKLISFGIDYSGIPIICDCNLEPFLSLAKEIIDVLWLDYFNVTCKGPEKHNGTAVHKVPLAELVCPIPQEKGCQQPECTCIDKPRDQTLYINCSYQNLDKFPEIPKSNHSMYVSLNLSGNSITEIANMTYLSKLRTLDIANNDLHEISDDIAKQLENCTYIDISNNPKIEKLPVSFQTRDICNTSMRQLDISCTCQTAWLETWIASKTCEENNLFRCDIPNVGLTSAHDFHVSELECFLDTLFYVLGSVIAGIVLLLVVTSVSSYWLRYELLILYLRLRRRNKRNIILPYKYDVFISFNDNEGHVNEWISKILDPRLQESGYTTFMALRDSACGGERNSEIKEAILNSHNFLIVLSDGYLVKADQGMRSWTENEWKFGWNNFRADRGKNIVLVNFDHLEPSDVDDPVISAYLRVGCTVDFKNHDGNIMTDIETKLGKPMTRYGDKRKGNDNMNKKFTNYGIFVTTSYPDGDSDFEIELEEKLNEKDNNLGNMDNDLNVSKLKMKQRENHHVPKLCRYRKCYACMQKELALQNELAKIQNGLALQNEHKM